MPRSGVEPSDRLDPRLVTLNGDDRPRAPYSCGACLRPAQGRWVP